MKLFKGIKRPSKGTEQKTKGNENQKLEDNLMELTKLARAGQLKTMDY